jgi:hypothetical protein
MIACMTSGSRTLRGWQKSTEGHNCLHINPLPAQLARASTPAVRRSAVRFFRHTPTTITRETFVTGNEWVRIAPRIGAAHLRADLIRIVQGT